MNIESFGALELSAPVTTTTTATTTTPPHPAIAKPYLQNL